MLQLQLVFGLGLDFSAFAVECLRIDGHVIIDDLRLEVGGGALRFFLTTRQLRVLDIRSDSIQALQELLVIPPRLLYELCILTWSKNYLSQ